MPTTRNPYPAEFRSQIVALARAGRNFASLAREFETYVVTIHEWIKRIAEIHTVSKETYGANRIHAELCDERVSVGRKRIERLMKAKGLKGWNL